MIIKELIRDFFLKERGFRGVEREIEIKEFENRIVSVIEPRKAGKTTLMIYLLERKYRDAVYVNFEDIVFRKMKPEEFFEVIKIFVEVKGFYPKTLLLYKLLRIGRYF